MFQSIPQESIDFFWELALNNQRPWFQEHKEEFQQVVQRPFQDLAHETLERMREQWPQRGFQLHISRIYRDARRLYGKGPYQDHLWFSLQRGDHQARGPMFWFEMGKDGTSHGVGCWEATGAQWELFRKRIAADPAGFEELILSLPHQDRLRLWGQEYKRPKGSFGPVIDPWYNRREVSAGWEDFFGQDLFSPQLPQLLTESFGGLMPLYQFYLGAWQSR